MEDFQKALLRLMTSSLTESERIQLIGQLQFAIVLLQKQQQQFEEKREEERSLGLGEVRPQQQQQPQQPQQERQQPPPAPPPHEQQQQKPQQRAAQQQQHPPKQEHTHDCLSVLDTGLQLKLDKQETDSLGSLSAPPPQLLEREEEAAAFPYFAGVGEAAADDSLDNFSTVHDPGVSFCAPEIEVVQLSDSKSPSESVRAFSVSPREGEEDPLLAPITLEAEERSETELGDHQSDGAPSVGAGEFPPLRVSLRSKRKARKPRRMNPQEEVEEDDLLTPYHVCPECDLVWRRTNDYVCHLISHSPCPVTCAQCKGTFENTALLRSHECFDASQSLFFRRLCGYCNAGFVNKKAFNRHKRTTHALVTTIACNFCQRTFYDSRTYYAHLENSHVEKGWRVCRKCGHILDGDAAWRQHFRMNHPRTTVAPGQSNAAAGDNGETKTTRSRRMPFKCNYCAPKRSAASTPQNSESSWGLVAFATRAELREHVNSMHQIRCDDCGKVFRTTTALQRHRNCTHSAHSGSVGPAKRRRVSATLIGGAKDGIAAEMQLSHDGLSRGDADDDDDEDLMDEDSVRSISLPRCRSGRRLSTRTTTGTGAGTGAAPGVKSTKLRRAARSRARARRQQQQQLNGYKCRFCATRFHSYGVYREHLQLNHADQVRAGECRDCQQVFQTEESLEKHRLTRTHRQRSGEERMERQHLCELCGKNYLRLQALQRHMKTHINEYEFCCPHCDFKAVEKSNLKAHLSRHFDMKPFACDKCDSRFTSRRSLSDHINFKHSDSRDFFCETCGMGFKTLGTLARHKKGHSTEKPYVCFCGVQFNRLSNLRRHLKSVHNSDDTVLPVKRLKKFTNGVESVPLVASSQQQQQQPPPPPLQQQQPPPLQPQQQQQLVSMHMSAPASPPPASIMHNLHPLPVSPPLASQNHHSHVEAPRTPELPETDEDSTHAVLHSFLASADQPPHISAPASVAAEPQDEVPLLVHQAPPAPQSLYCHSGPGAPEPEVTATLHNPTSSCCVMPHSAPPAVAASAATGPMLRSLVGVGDDFGSPGPVPSTLRAPTAPSDHIWRPMGSVHESSAGDGGHVAPACTIVSSVNCVLDSGAAAAANVLPFDDVLWSSAVLPQTAAGSSCPTNSNSVTYLLSGAGSQVSLVADSSSSQLMFNPAVVPATTSSSSAGELTSTLMISHLTGDPLGLHNMTGSLVSPGVGPVQMAGEGQHPIQPHHHHQQQPHHQPHQQQPAGGQQQHQQHQQQQQQQQQTSSHQCSDFSVCYLIGSQNHVK